jgi:oxalate decarboxylase/phosphoglucose isomerase-like protein (cupin superfamily)
MPKISDKARNVYIFYQYPGDTVYIPYKYHHLVLNLSTSVAITHNYVPRMSERILSFLQDVKPDLSNEKYQKLDDYVRNNMNKLINNGNL